MSEYGFRDYSPDFGRWATKDPIVERGGISIYAMVGNRVNNVVDLYGLLGVPYEDQGAMDFPLDQDAWESYYDESGNIAGAHLIRTPIVKGSKAGECCCMIRVEKIVYRQKVAFPNVGVDTGFWNGLGLGWRIVTTPIFDLIKTHEYAHVAHNKVVLKKFADGQTPERKCCRDWLWGASRNVSDKFCDQIAQRLADKLKDRLTGYQHAVGDEFHAVAGDKITSATTTANITAGIEAGDAYCERRNETGSNPPV